MSAAAGSCYPIAMLLLQVRVAVTCYHNRMHYTHILYNYIIQLYIVGYVGYKLIAREGQSIAVPSGQARALHSKESCLERTDQ